MKKINLFFLLNLVLASQINAQIDSVAPSPQRTEKTKLALDSLGMKTGKEKDQIYKLKSAVDIPIIATGTLWSLYAFTKIYKKTPLDSMEVSALNKDNVNAFDRWGIYPYSKSLDKISYYPFYGAIPIPLLFFALDKKMRKDYFKLTYLYWEAFAITGLCGTASTYFVNRYRPYVYTSETSMDKRTASWALNSFYSGHSQVVAVSTFFCAKVYADYHPESSMKYVYYGIAAATTAYTGYLRLKCGEHFLSDILVGTTMGTLVGILVPQFHKHPVFKNSGLSLVPYMNGKMYGLAFSYKVR